MNGRTLSISAVLFVAFGIFPHDFDVSKVATKPQPAIPCQNSLTYRLGRLDSRFNLSKNEVLEIMREVEKLWSTALDRDLLDHDPNGTVVINLIYSEEQQRTTEKRKLSRRIEALKKQIEATRKEYQHLFRTYQRRKNQSLLTIPDYSFIQLSGFNEQREIRSLRRLVKEKSNSLNRLVKRQSQMIAKYNNKFSQPRKFEPGYYSGNGTEGTINIYQIPNRAELKIMLAHECGTSACRQS